MNFFDIKPEAFPQDGQYYFNILVITVAMNTQTWQAVMEDVQIEGIQNIWYTDELTTPEPTATCLYLDKDLDKEEVDFCIAAHPHKVVEISNSGICWYDMLDFDTDDLWGINAMLENDIDFDYEDE